MVIGVNGITLDCAGHSITGTGSGKGIFLASKTGVTIKNCVVSGFPSGIFLFTSSSNTLTSNIANNNNAGIVLASFSNFNTLTANIANNNSGDGIGIGAFSSSNTLTFNTANNNSGGGISLGAFSSSNNLTSNTANGNNKGIFLVLSSSNTLTFNTANNNFNGIFLFSSSNSNTITSNIANNNGRGIFISSSSNNLIFNNLFNNTNNAVATAGFSNNWNTALTPGTNIAGGPNLGGNLWLKPDGTGFSETCSDGNSDGICDSPRFISTGNVDNLPLTLLVDTDGDGVPDAIDLCPGTAAGSAVDPNGCSNVEAIQGLNNELQQIVNINSGTPLADKVDDAADKVQTAVSELTKTPPDNLAAVGNIEGAVGDLIAAVNDNGLDLNVGIELMNQLVAVAGQIAQDALDEATACDPTNPDLVFAQQSMNSGDALRASGLSGPVEDFKNAVNAYKDALAIAQGVLGACLF